MKIGVNWRKISFLSYAKPRHSSWWERKGISPVGHLTIRTLHQQHIKRQYYSKCLKKKRMRVPFKRFLHGLDPSKPMYAETMHILQSQCILRPCTYTWCMLTMKCHGVEDQPRSRGHFFPHTIGCLWQMSCKANTWWRLANAWLQTEAFHQWGTC